MLTDPAPHNSDLAGFRESDKMTTLDLPVNGSLAAIARSIETAMKAEQTSNVRRACTDFVRIASSFYEVPDSSVRVLAARPLKVREQWTMELFGDYAPETMVIRVSCEAMICHVRSRFSQVSVQTWHTIVFRWDLSLPTACSLP